METGFHYRLRKLVGANQHGAKAKPRGGVPVYNPAVPPPQYTKPLLRVTEKGNKFPLYCSRVRLKNRPPTGQKS